MKKAYTLLELIIVLMLLGIILTYFSNRFYTYVGAKKIYESVDNFLYASSMDIYSLVLSKEKWNLCSKKKCKLELLSPQKVPTLFSNCYYYNKGYINCTLNITNNYEYLALSKILNDYKRNAFVKENNFIFLLRF